MQHHTTSSAAPLGSLRRGYLVKDETGAARPFPGLRLMKRRAFTFCGHRLPSLFRNAMMSPSWLRKAEALSSFQKYPTGVRGCETPGVPFANGGTV
ncbi:hypothetical protein TRM7557_03350 [Tritonibacter multivorans]|uniref:Uncharacterized protein n=1 Tax=Tritonibacter multivorans TaxID=928856 RepID=A0A0P1H0P4_9RHOB|nr:hypothetical protein TRM7557_03350 [Tritonibacter multivorans]SFC32698.1 hypothetical protein SAMN04488049_102186 [Tritonibacter multivorans]